MERAIREPGSLDAWRGSGRQQRRGLDVWDQVSSCAIDQQKCKECKDLKERCAMEWDLRGVMRRPARFGVPARHLASMRGCTRVAERGGKRTDGADTHLEDLAAGEGTAPICCCCRVER